MMSHDAGTHNVEKPLGPGEGERIECDIVINRTPAEMYALWRDQDVLTTIFSHVESVTPGSDGQSHWVLKGPFGSPYEMDVEIVSQVENEHIGWQSLPGGDFAAAGSVHFHAVGDGATEVRVVLRYEPTGWGVGAFVANLLGANPAEEIAEDLERLKQRIETGAVGKTDEVEVASEDSFPASDPPSWSGH